MLHVEESRHERAVTLASHRHTTGQLSVAIEGALQAETAVATWTAPPGYAVWIPGGIEHAERAAAGATVRHLRLDRSLSEALPGVSRSLAVSPLLREVINRLTSLGGVRDEVPEHVRLSAVLVDEVRSAPDAPLLLTSPRDPRALRVARLVEDNPSDRSSIEELAARAGVNRRTLERLFVAELGMSIGEWRQRLRLHHALRLLAAHMPVAEVARQSGYAATPAFIAVFRRHFGVTPHQYRRR